MPKDKSKKRPRLDKKTYEHHLAHLQEELVKLQEWVKQEGLKVVVLFEGRDAAGKGASSRRSPNPSTPGLPGHGAARPSDRERSQWYFQRYVAHLPAAGEMVLFDRSWYNRAGVERVMGFAATTSIASFCGPAPSSSGC